MCTLASFFIFLFWWRWNKWLCDGNETDGIHAILVTYQARKSNLPFRLKYLYKKPSWMLTHLEIYKKKFFVSFYWKNWVEWDSNLSFWLPTLFFIYYLNFMAQKLKKAIPEWLLSEENPKLRPSFPRLKQKSQM